MAATPSELAFENFCRRKNIRFTRVAEDAQKTVDYELFVPRHKIVVEVKELILSKKEQQAEQEMKEKGFSRLSTTPGARLRKKISDAAPQIKRHTQDQFPGMLVLYSGGTLKHIGPYSIRVAMYGFETAQVAVPKDPSVRPYTVGKKYGPKQRMTPHHNTSISAVGVLYGSDSDTVELIIYHNVHAVVPLDPRLFAHYGVQQHRLGESTPGEVAQWNKH
jgi:hypothetical protein